mgnify:CR=1 FL=1
MQEGGAMERSRNNQLAQYSELSFPLLQNEPDEIAFPT